MSKGGLDNWKDDIKPDDQTMGADGDRYCICGSKWKQWPSCTMSQCILRDGRARVQLESKDASP